MPEQTPSPKPRYVVTPKSESGHCCFKFSVVDTTAAPGPVELIAQVACECFTEAAKAICDALNRTNEENNARKNLTDAMEDSLKEQARLREENVRLAASLAVTATERDTIKARAEEMDKSVKWALAERDRAERSKQEAFEHYEALRKEQNKWLDGVGAESVRNADENFRLKARVTELEKERDDALFNCRAASSQAHQDRQLLLEAQRHLAAYEAPVPDADKQEALELAEHYEATGQNKHHDEISAFVDLARAYRQQAVTLADSDEAQDELLKERDGLEDMVEDLLKLFGLHNGTQYEWSSSFGYPDAVALAEDALHNLVQEAVAEADKAEQSALKQQLAQFEGAIEVTSSGWPIKPKQPLWLKYGNDSVNGIVHLGEGTRVFIVPPTTHQNKCEWCGGSGIIRSLGRDNDEVIEDCRCVPPTKQSAKTCDKCGTPLALSSGWVPSYNDPANSSGARESEPYCPKCEPTQPEDDPYEYRHTTCSRKSEDPYANELREQGWEEVHEKFERDDFTDRRTYRRLKANSAHEGEVRDGL